MPPIQEGEIILERMVRAVELVRQRLLRASAALNQANVPYSGALLGSLGTDEADVVPRQGSHPSPRLYRRRPDRLDLVRALCSGTGRTAPGIDRHSGGMITRKQRKQGNGC